MGRWFQHLKQLIGFSSISSKSDRSTSREAVLNIIGMSARSGNWSSIPWLLQYLAYDDVNVRAGAIQAIERLVGSMPYSEMARLEGFIRGSSESTDIWRKMSETKIHQTDWPLVVYAIFTMHPSGYVREMAVKKIAATRNNCSILSFLLLRVNDWVGEVRDAAVEAVRARLTLSDLDEWTFVLGLLERLRTRSRADHKWLWNELSDLLSSQSGHVALQNCLVSSDSRVARSAFLIALNLPLNARAKFIGPALESSDPLVRVPAARNVREWKEFPDREMYLSKMRADPHMPVRMEALNASLREASERRKLLLLDAMLDRHSAVRQGARYFAQQQSEVEGWPFDAREYYLNALQTPNHRRLIEAIGGLGETGNRGDVEFIMQHLAHERPKVAAAVVCAIARLDGNQRTTWLLTHLEDSRPAVASAAARELSKLDFRLFPFELRKVFRQGRCAHSRRLAFRILLRLPCYDATLIAIEGLDNSDQSISRTCYSFINDLRPSRCFYAPTQEQLESFSIELKKVQSLLNGSLTNRLRAVFGLERFGHTVD